MPGDAMEDVIFQYDGSFPGFLCCVFDSYAHKEFPIAFYSDEECVSLYPVRVVVTRRDHSQRVYDSLQRLSPPALKVLRRAWLTCLEDKELRLYAFIRKLYDQGPGFMRSKADDVYYPIACALRHLGGELEKLRGFVRFSDYNGILGGEIEPKNRVLPLLANHFCSRMAGEPFFLYDRTHRELLLYTKGQRRIVPVESLTLELPGPEELQYRALWQEFFRTVSIRERTNPRCQNSFLPKRYRGVMTEFLPVDYEGLNRPAAAGDLPAPGAPAGISAPGTPPGSGPSAPGSAP